MNDTEKIAYDTYEEAFADLTRIINTNYNPVPKRNVKPSRVYLSPITNKYHLTSNITIIEYPKK